MLWIVSVNLSIAYKFLDHILLIWFLSIKFWTNWWRFFTLGLELYCRVGQFHIWKVDLRLCFVNKINFLLLRILIWCYICIFDWSFKNLIRLVRTLQLGAYLFWKIVQSNFIIKIIIRFLLQLGLYCVLKLRCPLLNWGITIDLLH